jgi:hypothetical protein
MMMRRRGPGLVRGVARTAVVAGTATAVSGRVARRQAAKFDQKDQAAAEQQYEQQAPPQEQYAPQEAAPPPEAAEDPTVAEIRQLAELKDQGLLTEEEFTAKKKQLLGI